MTITQMVQNRQQQRIGELAWERKMRSRCEAAFCTW